MLESKGRPLAPGDVMVLVRRRNDFAARAGAGAEVARRAGRRPGPAGADRAAGGAGPDGAGRRAAAAAGRPDLRQPADQPAGRPVGRQPDGARDRPARRAVGGAARPRRRNAPTGRRPGSSSPLCCAASITSRRTRCSPRRSAGWAGAPGCSRGWGRKPPTRWTNCWPPRWPTQRKHPPSLQGFLHWLRQSGAEVKREQEAAGGTGAHHDRARRQGAAGAAGDPAGHHRAAAGRGRDRLGGRPADRTRACRSGRRARKCVAPPSPAARRGRRAADGGAQPAAVRRADARGGPAGDLRLADQREPLADACWYRLVARGFAALEAEAGPFAALGRHGAASATPQVASTPDAWQPAASRASAPTCRLGLARRRLAAAPPPAEPGRPVPLAPSRPEDAALGPVPPAASPLAEREPAAGGSCAAS